MLGGSAKREHIVTWIMAKYPVFAGQTFESILNNVQNILSTRKPFKKQENRQWYVNKEHWIEFQPQMNTRRVNTFQFKAKE